MGNQTPDGGCYRRGEFGGIRGEERADFADDICVLGRQSDVIEGFVDRAGVGVFGVRCQC
jgi:hypothetical protein